MNMIEIFFGQHHKSCEWHLLVTYYGAKKSMSSEGAMRRFAFILDHTWPQSTVLFSTMTPRELGKAILMEIGMILDIEESEDWGEEGYVISANKAVAEKIIPAIEEARPNFSFFSQGKINIEALQKYTGRFIEIIVENEYYRAEVASLSTEHSVLILSLHAMCVKEGQYWNLCAESETTLSIDLESVSLRPGPEYFVFANESAQARFPAFNAELFNVTDGSLVA